VLEQIVSRLSLGAGVSRVRGEILGKHESEKNSDIDEEHWADSCNGQFEDDTAILVVKCNFDASLTASS
jgi:hypothetical protein